MRYTPREPRTPSVSRYLLAAILIVITLLVSSQSLRAQTKRWGANGVTVSTNGKAWASLGLETTNMQKNGNMTTDRATGGSVIVWTQYDSISEIAWLQAQGLDANGTLRWPTQGVDVAPAFHENGMRQLYSQVVADNAGGAYVSWFQTTPYGLVDEWFQRVQHLTADGRREWGDSGITMTPAGYVMSSAIPNMWGGSPRLEPDGAGGVFVLNYAFPANGDSSLGTLFLSRWKSQGGSPARVWNPIAVFTGSPAEPFNLAMTIALAADGAGGAYAAFQTTPGGQWADRIARIGFGGILVWDTVIFRDKLIQSILPLCLYADSTGAFFEAPRVKDTVSMGAWITRMSSDGGISWRSTVPTPVPIAYAVPDSKGGLFVQVATRYGGGGPDDYEVLQVDLVMQHVNRVGETTFPVTGSTPGVDLGLMSGPFRCSLAADAVGDLLCAWPDTFNVLHMQRFDGNTGVPVWGQAAKDLASDAATAVLEPASGGDVLVAWATSNPGSTGGVRAQRMTDSIATSVDDATVFAPASLAIEQLTPSPAAERATLTLQGAANLIDVRIVDMIGRPVATIARGPFASGICTIPIDTQSLQPGPYVVVAHAVGHAVAKLFMVAH